MYITHIIFIMKKFIFIISIALVCFSCINNSNKSNVSKITEESNFPSDKLEFTSLSDTTIYHLANKSDMPKYEIITNIVYPLANGVAGDDNLLTKDFISNCIGKEYSKKENTEEALNSLTKDLIKNYITEVCGTTPENKIEGESWMNYEYILSNDILYNAHGILSYSCDTYVYTGGAHGLNTTLCYVYDFYDNKEVLINSIFKEESLPNVLSLIKEELAREEYADDIDMDNVNVTENFFVDDEGIHWIYNPYEIAPYALGAIEVSIPYSDIEKYMIDNTPIKSLL